MKICLLAEYTPYPDEGMKVIAAQLKEQLSRHHEAILLDPRGVFHRSFWGKIGNFKPQVIHYIPGPTLKSFMVMKLLSLRCKHVKTVMSAPFPFLNPCLTQILIPLLKPDLILTQSLKTEKMFCDLGCKTHFLPSGVDIVKFVPLPVESKIALRKKYGVDEAKFIILHVGHILKQRNLQILEALQDSENQVIIISSISTKNPDRNLYLELEKKGCMVWKTYFENIEEIYNLADCLVFPVKRGRGCIELPLSVMEAMACNLPVLSTRFGAIPRVFEEGDGLFFFDGQDELLGKLPEIKAGSIKVRTREKVMPYSWDNVTAKLEGIYADLIANSGKGTD